MQIFSTKQNSERHSGTKVHSSCQPVRTFTVPMLLLVLVVLGFCGMVGRAARAGFAPCGTGGLGLTGPPEELEEDVALRRGTGSGLVSPRGEVFSGEAGSGLLMEQLGDLFSGVVGWGLAAGI